MSISVRFYSALTLLVGASLSAQQPLHPAGADVVVIVPDSLPDVPRTLTELLAARAPGVTVQRATGSIGGGSWVSLRDAAAVRGADPLIVVDGVRRARHVLAEAGFDRGSGFSFPDFERRAPSPLDDIPVEDVERIEILRGPAAASAYGPDARYGVIVVTTRTPGRTPGIAASLGGGYASSSLEFPRATVRVASNGYACPIGSNCTPVATSSYTPLLDRPFLSQGSQRAARVAIDRSLGRVAGTASLSHERVEGVLPTDGRDRTSATARMSAPVGPVQVGYSGQWTVRGVALPTEDGAMGPYLGGVAYLPTDCSPTSPCGPDSVSRGYRGNFGLIEKTGARHRRMRTSHEVDLSARIGHNLQLETRLAGDWFGQDIRWANPAQSNLPNVKFDRTRHMSARFGSAEQAVRYELGNGERRAVSSLALRYEGGKARMSAFTGAVNYSYSPPLAGSSQLRLSEEFRRLQGVLQQRFSIDRLDAGVGMTVVKLDDRNTVRKDPTFGDPAIDAAFTLLRRSPLTLRARAAAARVRSFEPVPFDPIIIVPVYGAPPAPPWLPDRVTESEGGFDLSAGSLRASLSGYRKVERSERAIISIAPSPSYGPSIGPVTRAVRGLELSAAGDLPLLLARLHLDGFFALEQDQATTSPPFYEAVSTQYGYFLARRGESFGSWYAPDYQWADTNGDGRVQRNEMTRVEGSRAGRSRPSRLAALRSDLTVGSRWRLGAHLDYRGGHLVPDAVAMTRCLFGVCSALHDPGASNDQVIRALSVEGFSPTRTYLLPGDAIRVRELSLSYDDRSLSRLMRARGMRVTLAVRNAGFLWSRAGRGVWDPETFAAGTVDLSDIRAGVQSPIPREVVFRASLSY